MINVVQIFSVFKIIIFHIFDDKLYSNYPAMNRQNKKNKSKIADSTGLLNSIIELSPVGIFVVDEEDQIEAVNGSAKKMYGYSERAILSLKFMDLIPDFFLSRYIGYKKKEQMS